MVYTRVRILENVLEHFEKTLGSSRMFISEESINGNDVAVAPHRVSRPLNQSRSLVTIVLLQNKRCTARKRATATHKHTSLVLRIVNLEEYGDKPTQAANLDRRPWALARDVGSMETRYSKIRRGKEPYALLRLDDATPGVSTATTTTDQRRGYKTHQRDTQSLWFLLA